MGPLNPIRPTTRYRWHTPEGEPDPVCSALSGQIRPLSEWQNTIAPGFHPGCHAELQPVESAAQSPRPGRLPLEISMPPLRSLLYRARGGRIAALQTAIAPLPGLPSPGSTSRAAAGGD
ncbi:MAG: hypothetical protein U1B80_02200 [Anaerolineaceae bacterium]|nr:hypothetical protein [Anaerolineaceae bacterium]